MNWHFVIVTKWLCTKCYLCKVMELGFEFSNPELLWILNIKQKLQSVSKHPTVIQCTVQWIKIGNYETGCIQEAGKKNKTKVFENGSSYCFVSYWWIYFCLVFEKRKRVPKPLLGCQNFTSTGGCQNLVPGWHFQRRGPAWSVIVHYFVLYVQRSWFYLKNPKYNDERN